MKTELAIGGFVDSCAIVFSQYNSKHVMVCVLAFRIRFDLICAYQYFVAQTSRHKVKVRHR